MSSLFQDYLGRLPVGAAKALTHQERLLLEVKEKLAAMLGGHEFLTITHALPHVQTPGQQNVTLEFSHVPFDSQTA